MAFGLWSGNQTSIKEWISETQFRTTTFIIDNCSCVVETRQGDGEQNHRVNYVYDAAGQLTKIIDAATIPATGQPIAHDQIADEDRLETSYAYNARGQLATISDPDETNRLQAFGYNAAGELTVQAIGSTTGIFQDGRMVTVYLTHSLSRTCG